MQVVESVELVGEGETYDLKVPNTNNYVLADSGCIVHNSGKSVAAAIIFKCASDQPFGPDHVVYAEDSHSDLLAKLEKLNNDVLMIDELNKFLGHRSFMNQSQNLIIKVIEIARARKVATLSCVNAYQKVDKSFREGKVGLVVQMLDRRKKGQENELGRSVGAVFAAPPLMLSSSRFGLDSLADVKSDLEFTNLAPWVPAFCGFIFFPDKDEYLSKEEWDAYLEKKMEGIRKSFEQAKAQTRNAENKEFKKSEELSEDQEIEQALEKEEKKLKISEAKAQWKKEKNTVAKPEAVHHDCGCITDRDTRGLVYFKTKCHFHSNRPDKTNEIQLAHRKLEITEDDEESS